jgi:hypothetical protein
MLAIASSDLFSLRPSTTHQACSRMNNLFANLREELKPHARYLFVFLVFAGIALGLGYLCEPVGKHFASSQFTARLCAMDGFLMAFAISLYAIITICAVAKHLCKSWASAWQLTTGAKTWLEEVASDIEPMLVHFAAVLMQILGVCVYWEVAQQIKKIIPEHDLLFEYLRITNVNLALVFSGVFAVQLVGQLALHPARHALKAVWPLFVSLWSNLRLAVIWIRARFPRRSGPPPAEKQGDQL